MLIATNQIRMTQPGCNQSNENLIFSWLIKSYMLKQERAIFWRTIAALISISISFFIPD